MLLNRRKLRGTHHLVAWSIDRVERDRADLRDVIRAVYNAGRRRGRAELAAELGARLGFASELELELELPPLRVTPIGHAIVEREIEPAAPTYVRSELAASIVASVIARQAEVQIPKPRKRLRPAPKP